MGSFKTIPALLVIGNCNILNTSSITKANRSPKLFKTSPTASVMGNFRTDKAPLFKRSVNSSLGIFKTAPTTLVTTPTTSPNKPWPAEKKKRILSGGRCMSLDCVMGKITTYISGFSGNISLRPQHSPSSISSVSFLRAILLTNLCIQNFIHIRSATDQRKTDTQQ
ncbi:hypothetical protein FF38_02857 [Lucilia cuprina]|uniref:Uncharacterized protein n=1 Tax=Lucilia cuprina TaxID=7375 RepID=A0A0L0CGJ6_LUCCU|nr:hypothetical protein FF38_02857 [Lucilia cuprina]